MEYILTCISYGNTIESEISCLRAYHVVRNEEYRATLTDVKTRKNVSRKETPSHSYFQFSLGPGSSDVLYAKNGTFVGTTPMIHAR